MSVDFQHPEYQANVDTWTLVSDSVAGEKAVKAGGVTYLPKPNPTDTSAANAKRYEQYVARAVYYNFPGRTLQTLVGAAFRKVPVLEVSGGLDYVQGDISGTGVSIYQQAQDALGLTLQHGRCGLLVEYPRTEAPVSRADQIARGLHARAALYPASAIINWSTVRVGSRQLLGLVVLRESAQIPDADGFGFESVPQLRVMRLADSGVTAEVWRYGKGEWAIHETAVPVLDSSGSPLAEIPFIFIGANANTFEVDRSPLEDIARMAIAHYRNSADYEESVFFAGQVQPVLSGLSEQWRDHMEKHGVYVGSRAPLLLPEGGSYQLAQAAENQPALEAMRHKEELLTALGARLLQPGGAIKTATEAQGDSEAEHSVLSLAVSNVSEAYTAALAIMAAFNGSGDGVIAINQDFTANMLAPDMLAQQLAAVLAGKMPQSDLWANMRRAGLIDPEKTDEQIQAEVDSTPPALTLDN